MKKDKKILRGESGHENYVCKLCPSKNKKLIRKNQKGYEACQKLSLCPFCYKNLSKNYSKKGLALNEDQENIFDQTAAESDVEHALEDTRCQSSLFPS